MRAGSVPEAAERGDRLVDGVADRKYLLAEPEKRRRIWRVVALK
jgi:hypothetical protein